VHRPRIFDVLGIMSRLRFGHVAFLVASLASCAGDPPVQSPSVASPTLPPSAAASATSPADAALALPASSLRLTHGQHVIELTAAGDIVADGKSIARIRGAEVQALDGTTLLRIDPNGLVTGRDVSARVVLSKEGTISGEDGDRIAAGADGVIVRTRPDGTTRAGDYRLDGVTPETRRTGMALLLFASRTSAK
jgi:hypothetical protein